MPLLFDELFTCPNCYAVFQSKVLGSYDTFGTGYSDLYIASEQDPQPILHLINICPKCGFAAYSSDYKSFVKEDLSKLPEALETVKKITQKEPETFNAGDGYLLISEYSQNLSDEQKSFTIMQACHAYRFLEDTNLIRTRKLVLKSIEKILEKGVFEKNPKDLYLYLTGELHRLLGDMEEAMKYFKETLEITEKDSFVYRITVHQLSNPSEVIPREIFGKSR